MPATSQFTPQQILDAARRAEADHNAAYALQFYRHLAEHHPQTPESLLAREALNRLTRPALQVANSEFQTGARPEAPSFAQSAPLSDSRVVPLAPAQHLRPHPPVSQHQPAAPHAGHRPHSAAEHPHAHPRHNRHAPPVRHYKFGRALGHLLGLTGWIGLIAAIASLIVPALILFGILKSPPPLIPVVGVAVAVSALTSSLLLILLSQIARAAFDAADAARHAAGSDV